MVKLYEYTVKGRGEFPFDMLRYDNAWPGKELEMGLLSTKYMSRDEMLNARAISITGIAKPHEERWRSFGWVVHNVREVGRL